MRLIDADALKKEFRKDIMGGLNWERIIDNAPTVEQFDDTELQRAVGYADGYLKGKEERPTGKWIPVTYRPMTEEEEKELCSELGVKEGSLEEWEKKVFTCPLPDDGQEILVSHFGKYVQEDICSWDEYGCGLENNGDWDGVDAWMPKPEPYMKGGAE